MEYQSEKRICQSCKKDFTVESEDFFSMKKSKFRHRLGVRSADSNGDTPGEMKLLFTEDRVIFVEKAVLLFILLKNLTKYIVLHAGGETGGMQKILLRILTFLSHFSSSFTNFSLKFQESLF